MYMIFKELIEIDKDIQLIVTQGFSSLDANIYIIGTPENFFLVDCGLYKNFNHTRKILVQHGYDLSHMESIILTHCHADHAGAIPLFYQQAPNRYYASSQAAEALKQGDGSHTLGPLLDDPVQPTPVNSLDDLELWPLTSKSFQVISTPGHTSGSICLYDEKTRSLISGDTVFANGMVGRTDFPTSDPTALKQSLNLLLDFKVNRLLPGHGPVVLSDADTLIKAVQ